MDGTMECPMGCGYLISPLVSLAEDEVERADSFTTQYSLMLDHLQEDHDGRVGGR